MTKESEPQPIYECEFCGKNQGAVKRLVASKNRICICDECILLAVKTIMSSNDVIDISKNTEVIK